MPETGTSPAEQEIRSLMDSWVAAVASCDIKRILSHYADDVVAFDAIGPLRFQDAQSYGKHWDECLKHCKPPLQFKLAEFTLHVGGDTGSSHFLNHCVAIDTEGNEHKSWMRGSQIYARRHGEWKIVHEHFSVPFDPISGKSSFDLQP